MLRDPLAGAPDPSDADPHPRAAAQVLAAVGNRFPAAGLGVAGSVAARRHRPDSDVDLLAVDAAFAADTQYVFRQDGLRVNLLCVTPARCAARLRAESGRFAAPTLAYVLSTAPSRDPDGQLAALQRTAREMVRGRSRSRARLRAALDARVRALLEGSAAPLADRRVRRALVAAAVDAWFLDRDRLLLTKAEGSKPFLLIDAEEPAVGDALLAAVDPAAGSEPFHCLIRRFFSDSTAGFGEADAPG